MSVSEQIDQFIAEEKIDPHVKGYALAKRKIKPWIDDQSFPFDDIHDIIADAYADGWIDHKEINEKSSQFIAENGGNTRDALNVALTRLEAALNKVLVLEERFNQEQEESEENLPDSQ